MAKKKTGGNRHDVTIVCSTYEIVKFDITPSEIMQIVDDEADYDGVDTYLMDDGIQSVEVDGEELEDYAHEASYDLDELYNDPPYDTDEDSVHGLIESTESTFTAQIEVENFDSRRMIINGVKEIVYYIGTDPEVLKDLEDHGYISDFESTELPEKDVLRFPLEWHADEGGGLSYVIMNQELISIGDLYKKDTADVDCLDGATEIADSMYEEATFSSFEIPNGVTRIGEKAFCECWKLTSITIPSSVTSIGYGAFDGCSSLTSIEIPNSVTEIGDWAFCGCSSLTSIEIPNSVTKIGENAFRKCSSLTSIEIPNSVTEIGEETFRGCSALTSIVIPNSVTEIGHNAFSDCSGLTSVIIPSSVTSIGGGAFSDCSNLASVTIPSSVTWIGDFAFYGCSGLTSVTIPSSVTNIGHDAFNGCCGLDEVRFLCEHPENMQVDSNAFKGIGKKCVAYVPRGTKEKYLAHAAFRVFSDVKEE